MTHLVRVSSGEIIELPEGENSVGRGPLLQVKDKHVSRNHALLCLNSGKLSICPKHAANPCFYKAMGQATYLTLERNQWQDLYDGDCFSFLPAGDLAFRAVVVGKEDPHNAGTSDVTPTLQVSEELQPDPVADQPASPFSNIIDPQIPPPLSKTSPSFPEPETSHTDPPTSDPPPAPDDSLDDLLFGNAPLQLDAENTDRETDSKRVPKVTEAAVKLSSSNGNKEHSPVTTGGEEDQSDPGGAATAMSSENNEEETDDCGNQNEVAAGGSSASTAGSTNKPRVLPAWLASISTATNHASGKGGATKKGKASASKPVKQKASTSASDEDIVPKPKPAKKAENRGGAKKTPEAAAEQVATAKDEAAGGDEKQKKKPPCPYGSRCYRKNPAHFQEYSHEFSLATDSDDNSDHEEPSEPDKRPLCPFGAKCYRKNPAHRQEYAHPDLGTSKQKAASVQNTAGGRKRQRRGGDSDDDSQRTRQSTRATKGKRRKTGEDSEDDSQPNTYDYTDSFIDDEDFGSSSSGSAHGSDDSDWMPEEKGRDKEEEEDVAELVADADELIKNQKMRR